MDCAKLLARIGIALIVISSHSTVANAQWTALNNAPPGHLTTCHQLTAGQVMCHEYSTNRWRLLTPDAFGSFVNGTWSSTANMPNGTDTSTVGGGCAPCTYAPTYFASAVLADGRLAVIGGEYNTNGQTWTNIGFLYNPVTDAWSAQLTEPFGTGNVGDAQAVVLPNGTLLLADINNTNLASFNPATLSFTALNPTGKNDINDEENWNLLPNGDLLTVDSRTASFSEIYNPPTNAWSSGGATPVNLADTGAGTGNSLEVGPGVLRPDGTIIYFSGSVFGQNAVYDTATGTWTHTTAMDFPVLAGQQLSVPDGPASILPDGHVLVQASPITTTSAFNQPSHFFEFDGTNLTQVTDPPGAASLAAYQGRMLVLATGEVLFTGYDQANTDVVRVYSNGGTFQNAWRPVVITAPATVQSGNTYTLSGTQLNGLSQGASYGDDAHMATNYPLVRITNQGTGHVCYARTHDHSSMGVATGGATVSTQFDGPACLEAGPSQLVVVANGIPSLPVDINGPDLTIAKTHSPAVFTQSDSGDTFTITVSNAGASATSGVVTVQDFLPPSLVATAMAGSGWSCNVGTTTCTRASVLAAGASYPPITVTVDVAFNAPIQIINAATVAGGGEGSSSNVTDNDTTMDTVAVRQHTVTTVQPATQDYHDAVTLQATVSPSGAAGAVTFFIDGVNVGAASYTSGTGLATLTYTITQAPGSHAILAVFTSADALYLDSSGTATLTVAREETTLTYTGDTVIANGSTATMSGVLLEDGDPLAPIAGRTVTFTLGSGGGAQACSAVTSALGSASCTIGPVAQPLGLGGVLASFAGDPYYLPSSAEATTILFAFLDSGAFTVGDRSDAVGTAASFWGAQWSAQNSLSGGAASPSFKGFGGNVSTNLPTCGATWTTAPGNSSNPPSGPLPSYMGVLVPTHVTKSGSTLSGNVQAIVVVQTSGGYAPDPGHPGNGVIVAQYCHQ
jgi:uncharacterized repeat protein (TIGR01451 family)